MNCYIWHNTEDKKKYAIFANSLWEAGMLLRREGINEELFKSPPTIHPMPNGIVFYDLPASLITNKGLKDA